MSDSGVTPVYKITIQRESPVKGGQPKFSLVPENFSMSTKSGPGVPVPVSNAANQSTYQYVKCAVPNCNNYFDGQRCEFMGISYFPFPNDPELRQEWLTAIDLPLDKDTAQMKVCSDHFMNKDFVSDLIEVEMESVEVDDSQEGPRKKKTQETVELKPGVKPSVKLGQKMEKKETRKKNFKSYSRIGKSAKFKGLDNPLMDTANEIRSSVTPSSSMESAQCADESDTDGPVITSVGMLHPIAMDSETPLMRAGSPKTLGDIVEVEDDDDGMEEEGRLMNTQTYESEIEEGLINVPASVKLPPRKTITGESSSNAPKSPEPVQTSSKDSTLPNPSDDVIPSTSSCSADTPWIAPVRTRRRRRTRAEMLRTEEEDEWEPTFWSKKTLAKEGYEFEPKRRAKIQKVMVDPKDVDVSHEEEALDNSDEGFRIDEPISAKTQSSSDKRRRPGPASKTSRPQYVPPSQSSDQSDPDSSGPSGENPLKNGADEKDLEEVFADKSLLIDWAFFKSLLPELGKMSPQKRFELKNFMLDTLNARIYEGKPIEPSYKGPVKM